MRKIIGGLDLANKKFDLIEDGDKIMLGISGGKDSMLLAYAMKLYQKVLKERDGINFELIGCHVKQNFCVQDYQSFIDYFKKIDVELLLIDSKINEITFANVDKSGNISCSLCSKLRKGILVDHALKHKCNKIAMGHHIDDAVETLIMNITRQGRMATLAPKKYLDRKDMTLIRPLIITKESDIIKEVKRNEIVVSDCGCPNNGYTQRDLIRNKLDVLYNAEPSFRENVYNSLLNTDGIELWNKK